MGFTEEEVTRYSKLISPHGARFCDGGVKNKMAFDTNTQQNIEVTEKSNLTSDDKLTIQDAILLLNKGNFLFQDAVLGIKIIQKPRDML